MPDALCIQCTTSEKEVLFPTVKELAAHIKSGHTIMPPEKELLPSEPETTSKKEVVLTYKYEGQCPTCGREIDTLLMEIGEDSFYAIAYCPNCKLKLAEKKVIPLESQGGEKKK